MTTSEDEARRALARAADGGELIPTTDQLTVILLARIADHLSILTKENTND